MTRIVAVMLGGIGNMVLLTPALKALARAHPGARIDAVVASVAAWSVVERAPFAGRAFRYRSGRDLPRLVRWLRRPRPDLLFVATGHNPAKARWIARLAGARATAGEGPGFTHPVAPDFRIHEVPANLRIVAPFAPAREVPDPEVWTTEDDRAQAETVLFRHWGPGPRVALQAGCGAGLAFKRWPGERFRALAGRLAARGCSVAWLAGPGEQDQVAALAEGPVIPPVPIRVAAALLARLDLLVTNDSGPMHLAAAVGTPTVALFGPTHEARFGPWGDGHRVLSRTLGCRPCYPPRRSCADRRCLTALSVEEVEAAALDLLGPRRAVG